MNSTAQTTSPDVLVVPPAWNGIFYVVSSLSLAACVFSLYSRFKQKQFKKNFFHICLFATWFVFHVARMVDWTISFANNPYIGRPRYEYLNFKCVIHSITFLALGQGFNCINFLFLDVWFKMSTQYAERFPRIAKVAKWGSKHRFKMFISLNVINFILVYAFHFAFMPDYDRAYNAQAIPSLIMNILLLATFPNLCHMIYIIGTTKVPGARSQTRILTAIKLMAWAILGVAVAFGYMLQMVVLRRILQLNNVKTFEAYQTTYDGPSSRELLSLAADAFVYSFMGIFLTVPFVFTKCLCVTGLQLNNKNAEQQLPLREVKGTAAMSSSER